MKSYKIIRGKIQEDRCTNKGIYGSPLYCKCGCQVPQDTDPEINLSDVTVTSKSNSGYADFILSRNNKICGNINTQYNALYLDGYEFLGVDEDLIEDLLKAVRSIKTPDTNISAGDTIEETIAFEKVINQLEIKEQDEQNISHSGYCTKCHSYCYGDCES